MTLTTILIISVPLAMDAFAVAGPPAYTCRACM